MKSHSAYSPASQSSDEYLSIAETAARLGLSAKRVRNLMSVGVFRCGEHFFRPDGIAPRFKWSRVVAWLESAGQTVDDEVPLVRSSEHALPARGTRGYR